MESFYFQETAGRQWFVYVVYFVHSCGKNRQRRVRRSLDGSDLQLHSISSSTSHTGHRTVDVFVEEHTGKDTVWDKPPAHHPPFRSPEKDAPTLGEEQQMVSDVCLLGIVLYFFLSRQHRREQTDGNTSTL